MDVLLWLGAEHAHHDEKNYLEGINYLQTLDRINSLGFWGFGVLGFSMVGI